VFIDRICWWGRLPSIRASPRWMITPFSARAVESQMIQEEVAWAHSLSRRRAAADPAGG
jgi:hypothetical protein